jgi:hypothetical protein
VFVGDTNAVERDTDAVDRRRLDVAGLDSDGDIVVVGEAEWLNNDSYEAIPVCYDKMAACDPEETIWKSL